MTAYAAKTARPKTARPKMTAEEATTFETISETNATILMMAAHARGCRCLPYTDWFTYGRWQAQGYQVQRATEVGHGVKLTIYISIKDKDSGEVVGKRPWMTTVFCRCQVKPIDNKETCHE
jgi:hypothetical protein